MSDQQPPFHTFRNPTPDTLKTSIDQLVARYQHDRSSLLAWLIVYYAELLSQHTEYADSPEDRCLYQRLSCQWRWFAQQRTPSLAAQAT